MLIVLLLNYDDSECYESKMRALVAVLEKKLASISIVLNMVDEEEV
jgi:hypothetical protein